MLRKLFMFALTSGLLKKAYDHYKDSRSQAVAPRHVAKRRASGSVSADATAPKTPASRRRAASA